MDKQIPVIETQALAELYGDQNTILIDIRRPDEWDKGIIPGAHKIRLLNFLENKQEWSNQKHYVLICHSGLRSLVACKKLQEAGFQHVSNYAPGMQDWYAQKLPLAELQAV